MILFGSVLVPAVDICSFGLISIPFPALGKQQPGTTSRNLTLLHCSLDEAVNQGGRAGSETQAGPIRLFWEF